MSKKTDEYQKADITDPAVLDMIECHREGDSVVPNGKTMILMKFTPEQIVVAEEKEALRKLGNSRKFSVSDHLTDVAKYKGEVYDFPEARCRVCGTNRDVDKVEIVISLVNDNAPDSRRHGSLSHYCKTCLADRISGRMIRDWAPREGVSQARLDWLIEAKDLLEATNEMKGRHLLKLLPRFQPWGDPDLLAAVDGFPFTVFGTSLGGTNYFDLGALIRSWDDTRGLSEDCPICLGKGSLHVYSLSGSMLSGDARWSGFCRTCIRVIKRERTGPENDLSHWTDYFSRAKDEIGRSLLVRRRGL